MTLMMKTMTQKVKRQSLLYLLFYELSTSGPIVPRACRGATPQPVVSTICQGQDSNCSLIQVEVFKVCQ